MSSVWWLKNKFWSCRFRHKKCILQSTFRITQILHKEIFTSNILCWVSFPCLYFQPNYFIPMQIHNASLFSVKGYGKHDSKGLHPVTKPRSCTHRGSETCVLLIRCRSCDQELASLFVSASFSTEVPQYSITVGELCKTYRKVLLFSYRA
jgi:hypothetical protein